MPPINFSTTFGTLPARATGQILLLVCTAVLAARFYPRVHRDLDVDEIYFFHASHELSEGRHQDLEFWYPPLAWYIGACFFRATGSLLSTILASRAVVTTMGLAGFVLIFDVLRRVKLPWFMVPITGLIWFHSIFAEKLIEYRSDNVLGFLVVVQWYLLFLLCEGRRPAHRFVTAILALGALSLQISQKAVFLEIPLLAVFAATQFETLARFLKRHGRVAAGGLLLGGACIGFIPGIRRALLAPYIEGLKVVAWPRVEGGWSFIRTWWGHDPGFWALSAVCAAVLLVRMKGRTGYSLPPLGLLLGSVALLAFSVFPFLHYLQFLAWGGLMAMATAIHVCCNQLRAPRFLLGLLFAAAAIFSAVTHHPVRIPENRSPSAYADVIRKSEVVIGGNSVAAVNGLMITRSSTLGAPTGIQVLIANRAVPDWISRRLMETDTRFIFSPTGYPLLNLWATPPDRAFIQGNFARVEGWPLLIASQWHVLEAGQREVRIDLAGEYRVVVFTPAGGEPFLDGKEMDWKIPVRLDDGTHLLDRGGPAVVFAELASPYARSANATEVVRAEAKSYVPVGADFSGKVRLLGILRLSEGRRDTYRLFWEKTGALDRDLSFFHHFSKDGLVLDSKTVSPGNDWYTVKGLPVTTRFSYSFETNAAQGSVISIGAFFDDSPTESLAWNREDRYRVEPSRFR